MSVVFNSLFRAHQLRLLAMDTAKYRARRNDAVVVSSGTGYRVQGTRRPTFRLDESLG